MNKNSMRDAIIYYAHDRLHYTASELSEVYGVGAQHIRRIVQSVRRADKKETIEALIQRKYPTRNIETINSLRIFSKKLERDIDKSLSAIIAYAPEIQDTPFLDGIYCISDNLEYWQDELEAELNRFLRSCLADQTEEP